MKSTRTTPSDRHATKPSIGDEWMKEIGPGLYKLSDDTGQSLSLSLNKILPDGSSLLDQSNEHLRDTILLVLINARGSTDASIYSARGAVSLANSMMILVHWMFVHNIYYFRQLCAQDINQFITESAKGLDVCINATPRLLRSLEHTIGLVGKEVARTTTVTAALTAAGIPHEYKSKLPACLALLKTFKQSGELPSDSAISVPKRLSISALSKRTECFELLWNFRDQLPDSFKSPPFPNGSWTVVSRLGQTNGHTRTIPTETAGRLIRRAVEWVLVTGPKLLDFRDTLAREKAGQTAHKARVVRQQALEGLIATDITANWSKPLVGRIRPREAGVTVRTAIECFVPTAAWIVIATFTARRHIELSSLKQNSVTGTRETGRWINTYIGKTIRHNDSTPCPEIVVIAVELLKRWGGHEPNSDSRLFSASPSNTGRSQDFRVSGHLDNFACLVDANKYTSAGGEFEWHLAPHQCRRFFAILYVWRYDSPSLEALSYQLRHANLRQTLVYARDTELSRILSEESRRLTLHKLSEIASGTTQVAGVLGKRLTKTIAHMRSCIDVTDETGLERKLIEWVEHRGFSFTATIWGFCGARAVNPEIRRAACQAPHRDSRSLDSDGRPLTSASDEETCAGCWFHFTDASRQAHWVKVITELQHQIAAPNCTEMMQYALQSRLEVIQKFVDGAWHGRQS